MSGHHGYTGGYRSDLMDYAERDFLARCQRAAESSTGSGLIRRIGGRRRVVPRLRKGWCYRCSRGEKQCECPVEGGAK